MEIPRRAFREIKLFPKEHKKLQQKIDKFETDPHCPAILKSEIKNAIDDLQRIKIDGRHPRTQENYLKTLFSIYDYVWLAMRFMNAATETQTKGRSFIDDRLPDYPIQTLLANAEKNVQSAKQISSRSFPEDSGIMVELNNLTRQIRQLEITSNMSHLDFN